MQVDMHFYATYAIARAAGLPPDVAKTVATSAQFVDDAVLDKPVNAPNNKFLLPYITAHKLLSLKNVEPRDQWSIWVPFHFLPGNIGEGVAERLVCRQTDTKDSKCPGMQVRQFALGRKNESYGPHFMGLACHVLEDTFAHFGFSGISSNYNLLKQGSFENLGSGLDLSSFYVLHEAKATGEFAERTKLGHAGADVLPDLPWLHWRYEYECPPEECPRQTGHVVERDNLDHFMECAQFIYDTLREFAHDNANVAGFTGTRTFSEIEEHLRKAMTHEDKDADDRCEQWIESSRKGLFFDPATDEERKGVRYDETPWRPVTENITDPALSNAVRFNTGASLYLTFITDELLPELGLTF